MVDVTAESDANAIMIDTSILFEVTNVCLIDTRGEGMTDVNSLARNNMVEQGILALGDLRLFVEYCHYRGVAANVAGSIESYQAQRLWALVPELDQASTRGSASGVDRDPSNARPIGEDTRQKVCSLILCFPATSAIGALSASRRIATICSSVKRAFLHRLLDSSAGNRFRVIAVAMASFLGPLGFLGLSAPWGAKGADSVLRLTSAELVLSDAREPPPDSAPWKPQALPDDWRASRPGTYGYAWYRLRFELPAAPEQLFAVYMPVLQTAGALYVNGVEVGDSGTFDRSPLGFHARWSSFAQSPQLFPVRPDLLRPGANTLHLSLWVYKGARGAASPVTIGPEPSVHAMYERRLLVSLHGLEMIVVFGVAFGLFMLLLWLRRPHESMYGYFGLTALLFPIWIAGKYIVVEPPVPNPYWGVIVRFGLDGYTALMCLFALRYGGWRLPRLERGLLTFVALSALVNCYYYSGGNGWVARNWWHLSFVPAAAYVTIFWAIAWQRKTPVTLCLAVAASIKLAVAVHENLLPYPVDLPRYMPYSYLPMFIMIGWILVDRFVKALNESEALNTELEARVTQKHAELQENYRRMQDMEQQRVMIEERQRIMRDMHDGIGAHLISTLSQVEHGQLSSEEVAAALRECIEDLRLTIDSLEPADDDLLAVLGNLRYRLEPRLKRCGIALDWQVQDVPRLACLDPKNVLHILRILQEGFTNILKHADANRVTVQTGVDRGNVYVRVKDNGHGFAGECKGHGLASMRHRAQTIGGQLEIEPSSAGTTLSLLLPIST